MKLVLLIIGRALLLGAGVYLIILAAIAKSTAHGVAGMVLLGLFVAFGYVDLSQNDPPGIRGLARGKRPPFTK